MRGLAICLVTALLFVTTQCRMNGVYVGRSDEPYDGGPAKTFAGSRSYDDGETAAYDEAGGPYDSAETKGYGNDRAYDIVDASAISKGEEGFYTRHPGQDPLYPDSQPSYTPHSFRHANDEPISLEQVLNYKLDAPPSMCPRQNVMLFFLTRDMKYLRPCMPPGLKGAHLGTAEIGESFTQDRQTGASNGLSYSGRLLKRILHNINKGTAKIDAPQLSGVVAKRKRSRLSINSALTSLSDMLRHETPEYPAKPVYGVHNKLLKMG